MTSVSVRLLDPVSTRLSSVFAVLVISSAGTWVPWAVARLKQCGRKYSTQIKPFMATLESVVISGIDEMRVNEAFEAFKDF